MNAASAFLEKSLCTAEEFIVLLPIAHVVILFPVLTANAKKTILRRPMLSLKLFPICGV